MVLCLEMSSILWIKAAFCWVAVILRDRLLSKISAGSVMILVLHINITTDVLSIPRKQEVKQMNSMEIWSYYFVPQVMCLFTSWEYLGME